MDTHVILVLHNPADVKKLQGKHRNLAEAKCYVCPWRLRAALDKADDTHSMGVQFGTQSFESIISFRTTCKAHLLEHKNSDTACKQAVCVTNLELKSTQI